MGNLMTYLLYHLLHWVTPVKFKTLAKPVLLLVCVVSSWFWFIVLLPVLVGPGLLPSYLLVVTAVLGCSRQVGGRAY